MSKILLSIKPKYAHQILNGSKKYEYRKRLAKDVDTIIIYSSAPDGFVIGEVEVKGTLSMSKTALWETTKSQSGISREKYREYFDKHKTAHAYILGKVLPYPKAITLDMIGIGHAPQSFIYLKVCPFCGNILSRNKCYSGYSTSNSEEHIIPYSVGNSDLVIPKGIICDDCNNYFALNIEKQFLEIEPIKLLRSYHTIPSRKNKVPPIGIRINKKTSLLEFDPDNNCAYIGLPKDTIDKIANGSIQNFYTKGINIETLKNNYYVSRFLIKTFTEIALYYSLKYTAHEEKIGLYKFDSTMMKLVKYVRQGDKQKEIYRYTVKQVKEIKPFSNDDFIADITINIDESNNIITGMTLTLFEVQFEVFINE